MTRTGLVVRKVADMSSAIEKYNHTTGEALLEKPNGDTWPLKGLQIEGEAPSEIRVPMSWVSRGVDEGWIIVKNEQVKRYPGGPPDKPWRNDKVHTIFHCDEIVLKTLDGDFVYKVVAQPGKYVMEEGVRVREATATDVEKGVPCQTFWYFDADLAS